MPPVPPSVAAQQQQPAALAQFAQGSGGQGTIQNAPSMQLVEGMMNDVTNKLESIARIVQQERPELIPLLKPVVQGLVMFMQAAKSKDSGAPKGGAQGTAGQASPDATGGAAMGMPPQ